MGNPLAQLLAMLQGNSLGMLPSQPQGVRPGFGLQGASVQGSDLRDVLRNIPEDQQKMGIIPIAARFGGKSIPMKDLRGLLKGGSLEWSPTPGKPWTLRFPEGDAFRKFDSPDTAMEWVAKNKIELR